MPRRQGRTPRAVTTPVRHPHAAGIDVGATELYVWVPLDRDPQPIRRRTESRLRAQARVLGFQLVPVVEQSVS